MTRNVNPAPQYLQGGRPVKNGQMFYFEPLTNTPKDTFADNLETPSAKNAHPVLLDANGMLPNVFFTGSARQMLINDKGLQVFDRDPVGGENTLQDFSLFENTTIYSLNDKVEALDGRFYISLSNANQDNDPRTVASKWTQIRFIRVFNTNETFNIGDIVQEATGELWKSLVNTNLGNLPSTSPTKWEPAISGVDVPEIIALETRTTTVIPQTVSGTLSAFRINELRDGGTFTLPLAASVAANQTIVIVLPDKFKTQTPTVNRAGSDTITDGAGSGTSFVFSAAFRLYLTSDGVSDWSF